MEFSTSAGVIRLRASRIRAFRELRTLAFREGPLAGSFVRYRGIESLLTGGADVDVEQVVRRIADRIRRRGFGLFSVEVDMLAPIGWATVTTPEDIRTRHPFIGASWLGDLDNYTEERPLGRGGARALFVTDPSILAPLTCKVTVLCDARRATHHSHLSWIVYINIIRPGPKLGDLSRLDPARLQCGDLLFFDWDHQGEPMPASC